MTQQELTSNVVPLYESASPRTYVPCIHYYRKLEKIGILLKESHEKSGQTLQKRYSHVPATHPPAELKERPEFPICL